MKLNRERRWLILLIFLIVLALLLASTAFLLIFKKPPSGIEMTGLEISQRIGKFLASLEKDGKLFEGLTCEVQDKCRLVDSENPTAVAAWHLIGNARLYEVTKDGQYKDRAVQALRQTAKFTNFFQLWVNFRQIVDGARILDESSALNNPMSIGMLAADKCLNDPEKFSEENIMLSSLHIAEWAQLFRLQDQPWAMEFLNGNGYFGKPLSPDVSERYWAPFPRASKALLEVINEMDASDRQNVISGFPEFKLNSCWTQFAKMNAYLGFGDASLLDEVKSFFQGAEFAKRTRNDIDINPIQLLLPCAEVLKSLGRIDPAYKKDFKAIVELFLLKYWDTDVHKICSADEGVISVRSRPYLAPCDNIRKNASDNAWLIDLLADEETTFLVNSEK